MNKVTILAILPIVVLLAGCAGRERADMAGMREVPAYAPAAEAIGMPVRDPQGQPVGQLENVIVDWQTGRIGYGVVSSEGSSYLVPWSVVSVSPEDRTSLRLKVDRQKVVTAPRYERGAPIPRATSLQIHQHYGISPIWEDTVTERPRPGMPAITDPSYPTGNVPSTGIPSR